MTELRFRSQYGIVLVYLVHKPAKKIVETVIYFTLKPGCGYDVYHRDLTTGARLSNVKSTHANTRLDWDLPEFMLDYPLETLQPLIEGIIEWHMVNNELFIWDLEPQPSEAKPEPLKFDPPEFDYQR